MKALSWLRAKPKTIASAASVTAGVIALTTLAFVYDGNPTAKVDLNDGGVWITKTSSLMVGHFNNESTVLDGGLRTAGASYDIVQDAATILVTDRTNATLTAVDPARVSLEDSIDIPGSSKIDLGARTVAILDTDSGDLWVVPVGALSGFEFQAADPTINLGKNADVVVGDDGTVYGLSSEDALIATIPVDQDAQPLEPTTQQIDDLDTAVVPSITVVGTTPVVLSPADSAVIAPGGVRAEITEADSAVLQQASAVSDAVAVATASQLISIPLDGGEATTTTAGGAGAPAAPVQLLGCTYGAWGSIDRFVRECPTDADDVAADIPGIEGTTNLTFRVNRDVIILNDTIAGTAWLADESLQQVDNWNDLTPPEGKDEEEEEDTTEQTEDTTLPVRTNVNTPPVAENDEYGVRPGQTTMLPVLDNDNDADGDVLVAAVSGQQPSIGTVQPIYDGGSLQIAVDEDASGAASFTYEIDDGRTGKDSATVDLSVKDWDVNTPPQPQRTTTLEIETGGTVSYNVLPDWIDPEGDDFYLQDVIAAEGDEVDFTTDGQITYRAVASMQGRKEVIVTVADALGEAASGTIVLDVRPSGSTLPKTNADHVMTRVNEQVTVAPLSNDSSSGREQLRLTKVNGDETPGGIIEPDLPNKTFTFSAPKAGVYYVLYEVAAGPNGVQGIVRIDVSDETDDQLPPIAVRDVALLPAGGEVLLGVLNNDTDPAGGILVVQSVSVDSNSGVSVSILNHETLRIGDQGSLDESVRLTYRISNGSKTAEGEVVVIPIPAPETILPPVAGPDQAIVRVGDVVTIPVLDNDTSPIGDDLTLEPDLIEPFIDPADGEIFVSEDAVRFRAGSEPKTVYATYEVSDTRGNKVGGYITIQILPVGEENAAPRPQDLTARALSGGIANIAVPLDGIDPDGDSVELLGLASNPTKGRVTEVAQNYFVYEAYADSAGVDTFSYRVRDRLGAEATATVRVGVAAAEDVNQAPYAVKDSVVVRPGREVAVPVLANDSDPEGDKISLVKKGIDAPDGLEARVSGDRVLIQAPQEATETSLRYTIVDAKGATASAVVQITVDADVPLLPPIARDDWVSTADLVDDLLTVDVDILANDEDPDGTTEALEVEVGEGAVPLEDGKYQVTVGDEMQLIRYSVTDVDGLSTSAFIFVPALQELPPYQIWTEPVVVGSGETIELPLEQYVGVIGGGGVVITEHGKVSASHANGADLVKDERTLVYTSADRYFGSDAVTFEVTDGDGPDDPDGRKSTLSIPITVLPPINQQPTFTRSSMDIAPGEDAITMDLAALTTDPDPEDSHTFRLAEQPGGGITARVEGATLSVEASDNVDKGTTVDLAIEVSDGETEPVRGVVTVNVTASIRPLATANTDTVDEAHQGEEITIPVLDNDVNPFPETPLSLVTVSIETGKGKAAVDGDEVSLIPDKDFVGTLVARYTIQDATEDGDRQVDGRIVVTVQGVPDAPGRPQVTSVQDRTVVVSFSAPSNNGAEIEKYTITSVKGSKYSKECKSTTCTLDGLTNNVEYAFQVVATNRVGDSDASSTSEVARPDARPDTPNAPKLTFGDKSLSVAWTVPTTPGSPVESYTLQISPAPPSGVTQRTSTGTSLTWDGLENGTSYQIRVRAHNRAPEPSSWSTWSLEKVPAGRPAAPDAPTTAELSPVGSQAQMQVTWAAPYNNGDKISRYQLQVMRGGSTVSTVTVPAGQTSQAVVVDTSESGYTYIVRAENKAGWGEWSAASVERRGATRPDAPTAPVIAAGDQSITLTSSYTLSADQRNGAKESEITYQYRLNSSGDWQNLTSTTIGGLTNGSSYTLQLRALSNTGDGSYTGAESTVSAAAIPHGKPHTPAASAAGGTTTVALSWDASGSANGRTIQVVQISVDGAGWESVALSGTRTVGTDYEQTHSIAVKAIDTEGQESDVSATASATSATRPPPRAWVTPGSYVSNDYCSDGTCAKFVVNTKDFPAGTYQVACYTSNSEYDSTGGRFTEPQAYDIPANGVKELRCFHGSRWGAYQVWVSINGVEYEKATWQ